MMIPFFLIILTEIMSFVVIIDTIEQKPDSLHPFEHIVAANSISHVDPEKINRESLITESILKNKLNESLT